MPDHSTGFTEFALKLQRDGPLIQIERMRFYLIVLQEATKLSRGAHRDRRTPCSLNLGKVPCKKPDEMRYTQTQTI